MPKSIDDKINMSQSQYILLYDEYESGDDFSIQVCHPTYKLFTSLSEVIKFQFFSEISTAIKRSNFELFELTKSQIKIKETQEYKKLDFDLNLSKQIEAYKDELKEYESIVSHLQSMLRASSTKIKNNYFYDQAEVLKKKIEQYKILINKLSDQKEITKNNPTHCPKCNIHAGPITDDCLTLHCNTCNYTFDLPLNSLLIQSCFLCEHANECSNNCTCPNNCYCKQNTCLR